MSIIRAHGNMNNGNSKHGSAIGITRRNTNQKLQDPHMLMVSVFWKMSDVRNKVVPSGRTYIRSTRRKK